MPSFPTSVWNPATKNTGDTIQAAHVNDAVTEINAIEDGYINGTARLNSSNSTLAALSVTGNSTLASTITIGSQRYIFPSSGGSTGQVLTCISTSGSTMGLEWRVAAAVPDAARVSLDLIQQVGNNSTAAVSWTSQVFLTNSSLHSTVSNPDRLTPQSTGIYGLLVTLGFQAGGTASSNYFTVDILDSSAGLVGQIQAPPVSSNSFTAQVQGIKRIDTLAASPWFRVRVNQLTGSTNRIRTQESFFAIWKL